MDLNMKEFLQHCVYLRHYHICPLNHMHILEIKLEPALSRFISLVFQQYTQHIHFILFIISTLYIIIYTRVAQQVCLALFPGLSPLLGGSCEGPGDEATGTSCFPMVKPPIMVGVYVFASCASQRPLNQQVWIS